jgi:serine/threonine-protein kinase
MDPAHQIYSDRVNDPRDEAVDDEMEVVDSDVFDLVNRHGSDVAFVPDAQISDNIRLLSLLGTGGMGNVWLAEHGGLETRVAVKFMSTDLAGDPACIARFAGEAKLAARIKSPHVVNILDFATTPSNIPFIVMELLDGEDLEARIRGGRALSLEDSSRIVVQLCKALSKAHALGIVHRDIKPDNVFLADQEGEIFVKVLDFGIAKDQGREQSITVSGTTMGTPSYMSPEQIFRPKEVDLRSDLWSAAVVAYRCLTGQLPFEGDTFGTMCLSVHDGHFAAPSSIDSNLPRELDAWFEKALSLDPNARFQSASEMANAYLSVLAKAGLLPRWAALRDTSSDRPSYTSDPSGISGGPIVLRRTKWPIERTVVLGLLVAVGATIALLPRNAFLELAGQWFDVPQMPQLYPTLDDAPLSFDEPSPPWRAPAGPPARAPREWERSPAFNKAPPSDPFGLSPAHARDSLPSEGIDPLPSTIDQGI